MTNSKPSGVIESISERQEEILSEIKSLKSMLQAALAKDTAEPDKAEEAKPPVKKKTATRKKTAAKKEDVDWVKRAVTLARKAVADGVDRKDIFAILEDHGVSTISQANQTKAEEIFHEIKDLSSSDSGEF